MNKSVCILCSFLAFALSACGGCDTAPSSQNKTPPKDMGSTPDMTNDKCVDRDKDGYYTGEGCNATELDCNDFSKSTNPGTPDICGDLRDNNCNGTVDETCPCRTGELRLCSSHADPRNLGGPEIRCRAGVQRCVDGAWSELCEGEIGPIEEECNRIDDNCDGVVDEGLRTPLGLCISDLPDGYIHPIESCGPTDEGNGLDDDGNGMVDETCSCSVPDFDPDLPRKGQPCYAGPPATLGVGTCKGGTRDCVNASWSTCTGSIVPVDEVCGDELDNDCDGIVDNGCHSCIKTEEEETLCDGIDNDCDGFIDENLRNTCGGCGAVDLTDTCNDGIDNNCNGEVDESCQCTKAQQPCYNGPPEAAGVGICIYGTQMCEGEYYGACIGSVTPGIELCGESGTGNGADDDCDGEVDEGCGCVDGSTRPCGSNTGVCKYGTQTCAAGTWGVCSAGVSATEPTGEVTCDGIDNDCDGLTDENLLNACGTCGDSCYTQTFDPTMTGQMDESVEIVDANDPENPRSKPGLSLTKATTFPSFLWAANSNTDGVSKIDTDTNEEVARYWVGDNPSRTAVDLDGNMWVIGRNDGRVTKVMWNETDCIDRNNNNVIDTSRRIAGVVTVLNSAADPFADECVVYSQVIDPAHPSGRGVTVDPTGRVWFGFSTNPGGLKSIDPHTFVLGPTYLANAVPRWTRNSNGVFEPTSNTVDLGRCYGITSNAQGIIYYVNWDGRELAAFDTSTHTWIAYYAGLGCGSYGISLDAQERIWLGCWSGSSFGGVSVFDPSTLTSQRFGFSEAWFVANGVTPADGTTMPVEMDPALMSSRFRTSAVAVEPETGHIWTTSEANGYIWRLEYNEQNPAQSQWVAIGAFLNAMRTYIPEVSSIRAMRGIGFDRNGFVWHLGLGSEYAIKIDPATNTRLMTVPMPGAGGHYTYSDFTGSSLFNFIAPRGVWRTYFNTQFNQAQVDAIYIEAHVPNNSTLGVRIRPLDTMGNPSGAWVPAEVAGPQFIDYPVGAQDHLIDLSANGGPAIGNQFEIDIQITTTDRSVRPIIYDIQLQWQRP